MLNFDCTVQILNLEVVTKNIEQNTRKMKASISQWHGTVSKHGLFEKLLYRNPFNYKPILFFEEDLLLKIF